MSGLLLLPHNQLKMLKQLPQHTEATRPYFNKKRGDLSSLQHIFPPFVTPEMIIIIFIFSFIFSICLFGGNYEGGLQDVIPSLLSPPPLLNILYLSGD